MQMIENRINLIYSDSPQEIEDRLRRRYLDRLGGRVKKLRKLLIERNWEELRTEYTQLAVSGVTFGFSSITQLADSAQATLPPGRISRALTPLHAKERTEALISEIDSLLTTYNVLRH